MHDRRRTLSLTVFLLFFLSGATSLVYEVIWLRQLILIFGSTLFATSAVLSTFMGGLALGAFLAGRFMDRSGSSPLRVYGLLEIGIGLYALVVPFLFSALGPVYRVVWQSGGSESLVLLSLAKFVGIAIVLLPPTTLMGASLPVLARFVADDERRIGGKVGTLYAINTFGAVVGTFSAGFIAIPGIGVQKTLWLTAAANLALGGAAILAARRVASRPVAPAAETAVSPVRVTGWRTYLLLTLFGLSGFGAMVLEVAWTRALALVLGSSVYAFSLMLVAFLVGLAVGSAVFAGLLRRRPDLHPGVLLALLLAASGLLAYTTGHVLNHLPRLFGEIFFAWSPSPAGWFAVQFFFGLLVMFPATVAFGGIFPAVLQLHARSLNEVSASVGTVYAANTTGTILGAAAAGFLLVPKLGVLDSIIAIAAVQILLGLLATVVLVRGRSMVKARFVVPMLAALVLALVLRPGWDVRTMNSGVYMNLHGMSGEGGWSDFIEGVMGEVVPVFVEEGLTASIMVADQPSIQNRYLAVNGKIEASTTADMESQIMCAHLPLLLHPAPRDVMVIGLASGITAGSAATHSVDTIRIVEIEGEMVPAAHLFDDHNHRVLDDPRVVVSVNDARNELEFSEQAYDVIISQPSNPWMTVASNLFTEDFFRLASQRLRPHGIFAQWVQNYCLPAEDLRSIVAAYRAAFPYVMMFETCDGVDLVLLGSREPLPLDMERIGERMSELRVRMDLTRVGARRPMDLLPLFRLGPDEVESFVEGAARNTDDNARVEFSAPKALYLNTLPENMALIYEHVRDPLTHVEPRPSPGEELDRLRLDLAEAWLRRGDKEQALAYVEVTLDGPLGDEAREIAARVNGM